MKRARIKAMVTVPARRKATQDTQVTCILSETEHNDEHKNIVNDISKVVEETQPNLHEKQIERNMEAVEDIQNEEACVEDQNDKHKCESIESPESRNDSAQKIDTLHILGKSSPIKVTQNRLGFMRPIPKFDNNGSIRRNSVQGSGASASESEDDSKKATAVSGNHNRNDSEQSVQHSKNSSVNSGKNNLLTTKVGQKRRIPISESARKLAEARREFHLKHENKTPDRSKLTMYDLIYYNPVTNPMKKSKESVQITKRRLESESEELQKEENEDDPSSAMPVPQVKVGPDGQLIIDEQSLIIEQTDVKKNRGVLAKEAIVDDENSGSGFYKKRQKNGVWPRYETLKFYKALSTVGTDFLLMQTLFPNRTRQEIKLKFKKEDRVNRDLIEKALAYHQEFDMEILEKSLATYDSSEDHSPAAEKRKRQRTKVKRVAKPNKRRKSRMVAGSIEEGEILVKKQDEKNSSENKEQNGERQEALNKSNSACKEPLANTNLSEKSLTDVDELESLSSLNSIDSDTEVYRVRPTRSGRLPKVKKLQGPDINTLQYESLNYHPNDDDVTGSSGNNIEVPEHLVFDVGNVESDNPHVNSIKSVLPNIADVEPGSLVILSKESLEEPGKSVLQVYMVSSDGNSQDLEKSDIMPVNISPELLATVTAKLSDVESVTVNDDHK